MLNVPKKISRQHFMSFLLREISSNTGHAISRYLLIVDIFASTFLHLRILIRKAIVISVTAKS